MKKDKRKKGEIIMRYTSAQAAKLLRRLREEHQRLLAREAETQVFLAAVGEDVEALRPAYDYRAVQDKLAELEKQIRTIRHAMNLFNLNTVVEGMTIDELLVYLPQLGERKEKLGRMAERLPRKRAEAAGMGRFGAKAPIIDYEYANYDIEAAEEEFRRVTEEISRLQTALDRVNSTETMEIDI